MHGPERDSKAAELQVQAEFRPAVPEQPPWDPLGFPGQLVVLVLFVIVLMMGYGCN